MKNSILILFLLFLAYKYSFSQDSLSAKNKDKNKFEYGLTVSSFFSPKLYEDNMIINNNKSKLTYGGNFIVNYHFNKSIGIASGVGFLIFKNSFDYIFLYNNIPPNYDTSYFSNRSICLKLPVNLLWQINTEKKFNYFLNFGVSPSIIQSGTRYNGGSNNWIKPNDMNTASKIFIYNLSLGLKTPLDKCINYTVLLSYNWCNKPIYVSPIGNNIYTKNAFFSLNMGLCF